MYFVNALCSDSASCVYSSQDGGPAPERNDRKASRQEGRQMNEIFTALYFDGRGCGSRGIHPGDTCTGGEGWMEGSRSQAGLPFQSESDCCCNEPASADNARFLLFLLNGVDAMPEETARHRG